MASNLQDLISQHFTYNREGLMYHLTNLVLHGLKLPLRPQSLLRLFTETGPNPKDCEEGVKMLLENYVEISIGLLNLIALHGECDFQE